MKKFFGTHIKTLMVAMMSTIIVCMSIISSSAVDQSVDQSVQDAFSSALSTIQSDIMGFILLAMPVGLAIFGTIIAIKKGIGFVKSLLGKAS